MSAINADKSPPDIAWQPQPEAANFVRETVERLLGDSAVLRRLARQMRDETGTRISDWIDGIALPHTDALVSRLQRVGYRQDRTEGEGVWRNELGMFPPVRVAGAVEPREILLKVESVATFLFAQGLESVEIDGAPLSSIRRATIDASNGVAVTVIERHGGLGFAPTAVGEAGMGAVLRHTEAFQRRRRHFAAAGEGFDHAHALIRAAIADLGADRTTDLFFAAERAYWMRRNRAAQVQKARQDRLGLGWANHDHHTYRSSREHFARLIAILEAMGFVCRERFYAGERAGWGAQVLEQPRAGVVIFTDVDVTADEIVANFAHMPLAPGDELGTVGLWCALHGEAFLEAGMHHLECQFDFDAEREQLKANAVGSMAPFTLFPYLKQAFTEPEIWAVDPARIDDLMRRGLIDGAQAEKFRREGAVGSHLEVLQRDDGYKGFNQTGISDIIRRTDPRHAAAGGAIHAA